MTTPFLRPAAPLALLIVLAGGCASAPPGSSYPKSRSVSIPQPQTTHFGQHFAEIAARNPGRSGFRIFNIGVEGFLMRLEMINSAERSLDLQYYIFRGDETGKLIMDALARAADRGVRVRILVDDGETLSGDEQLFSLKSHGATEIRIFNPWAYRGHHQVLRAVEYLARHSRLDYRMHNKLLVADGSVALLGGRNIGDQYFQVDPESQFADDDIFVGGPILTDLSAEFDEYWNSTLAIPAEALHQHRPDREHGHARKVKSAGFNYAQKLAAGEPLAGIMSGALPLTWAQSQFVSDPVDKKSAMEDSRIGDFTYKPVAEMASRVKSELLVVSPYFVPTEDEMHLLAARCQAGVHVSVLTNSLESNPDVVAHAGYEHYRVELLQDGVRLYEIRARPGNTRGSGETAHLTHYGNYALHAKLYVMDRSELFIGSMNFDYRSRRLNTEMGLILENGELAQQQATRIEAMIRPENAYAVTLSPDDPPAGPKLIWHTVEGGKPVEYDQEPSRGFWQRVKARILTWLPLDSEL